MMLLVAFIWLISQQISAETWVAIDHNFVRLKKQTSCTSNSFSGVECDCCLIVQMKNNKLSLKDAVNFCRFQNVCSNHDDTQKPILRPFEIFDINKVRKFKGLSELTEINPNTIQSILAFISKEGHFLNLPSGPLNKDCFKVNALNDSLKGVHTGDLFAVSLRATCLQENTSKDKWQKLFIIKESTKGLPELLNLFAVRNSVLENEYIPTTQTIENNSPSKYIKIAFDELNFKIKTSKKSRYFSILQKAKGKSIHYYLLHLGFKLGNVDLSNQEREAFIFDAHNIFYQVGYALSTLHQKYALRTSDFKVLQDTYTHGDLHAQNIFYDDKSKLITLIDNETFAFSQKKPQSGINDLVDFYLLHTAKTVAHMFANQLWTNEEFHISDLLWHELWKNLFRGYLDAFQFNDDKEKRVELNEFSKAFLNALSNRRVVSSIDNLLDQRIIKRFGPTFRRNYVCRKFLTDIFENLLNEI